MNNSIIRIILLICFITIMAILMNKENIVISFVINEDTFEYNSEVYIKDIVSVNNASLLNENELLNTNTLGDNNYKITYINNKDKYHVDYKYSIIDTTKPLIIGSSSYTIQKGKKIDLINKMICADNYDDIPTCEILGDYNVDKVGTYDLTYKATDSSNNTTEKEFKLIVKSKIDSNSSSTKNKLIKDIIEDYKKDNTMIGIDVSSWQGNINWNKVKNSGVEFAIIRIGYGYNKNNENIFDSKFKDNLKEAKEAGLKVGLYYYSYAKNTEEATNQAKWIINSIDRQPLDLGIAFDWENWSTYNEYHLSLKKLNDIATSFIEELNNNGYDGMLYGSYNYLTKMWNNKYDITWLAHYNSETDYPNKYKIWQFTNAGKVDGINGYVDLNVLYY